MKELTREIRNKDEEVEDYKHKLDTLKAEKRKGEKVLSEVWPLEAVSEWCGVEKSVGILLMKYVVGVLLLWDDFRHFYDMLLVNIEV